tara:strand:- start:263 stop:544 length:282 start_codon:yes stop_codon:yes gene_type:complete
MTKSYMIIEEAKGKDLDEMWVCDYCGTEEVDEKAWVNMNSMEVTEPVDDTYYWCNCCNEEVHPMYYPEWQEKIIEECGGNKDKYDKIMDGSRM